MGQYCGCVEKEEGAMEIKTDMVKSLLTAEKNGPSVKGRK